MRRRWIVLPVVCFGLIAGSVGGYAAWIDRRFDLAFDGIADDSRDNFEASQLVQSYVRASTRGREAANQWLASEIEYAAKRRDMPALLALWTGDVASVRENEQAALLICRCLLIEDRTTELQNLRNSWRGRESRPSEWLAVDADALLESGRASECKALLLSQHLSGRDDAIRLGLLALTCNSPAEAQSLLSRAEALAPGNPVVRECRGRELMLEGRNDEAAEVFTAALGECGNDWLLRDRLAECYRRGHHVSAAIAIWLDGSPAQFVDFAWTKAWFWNRVARPLNRDWEETAPEVGRMRLLTNYLVSLPPGQFWLSEAECGQGKHEPAVQRQETYWLHLLASLQEGKERQAAGLLRAGPFRVSSWEPDLENALERVLTFRAGGAQRPPVDSCLTRKSPFFRQLEYLAADGCLRQGAPGLPGDVEKLLNSDDAFAATLLAAGWDEAGLILHHRTADLSNLPSWYVQSLAKALLANRGPGVSLEFVMQQPRSAELDLLAGELLLASERRPEALVRLRAAMAAEDTGPRAAWLLAVEALREGRPAEAEQTLEMFPQLTNDSEGQRLLARCAVALGQDDRAERLYRDLAYDSVEARSYLSRRAIKSGDFRTAGRLLSGVDAACGQ